MTTPPIPPPGPEPMQPVSLPPRETTPPRGPGVVVPFAVPPRDTDKTRTIVTIIISAIVAVLLCGGVAGGFGGVLIWYNNALTDEAMDTASDFMDDLSAADYEDAYAQLCKATRDNMSQTQFSGEWQDVGVEKYQLDPVVATESGDLEVPVHVTTAQGSQEFDLVMTMNPETMGVQVCGW